MVLLAYCIVPAPAAELPEEIRGRRVWLVEAGPLAAAVSRAAEPRMLDELEDTVEIEVRLRLEAAAAAGQSGTTGIEARPDWGGAWDRAAGELTGKFAGLFRRARQEGSGRIFSMHFLVPREEAPEFLRLGAQLQHTGKIVVVAGPWPPYDFCKR